MFCRLVFAGRQSQIMDDCIQLVRLREGVGKFVGRNVAPAEDVQYRLSPVEQYLRVEDLQGQGKARRVSAGILEELLGACTQAIPQLQVDRVGLADDASGRPSAQKSSVFGIGAADDAAEFETAIGLNDESVAAPAGKGFSGSETAEFAVFAVGDQVFGCSLQNDASASVAHKGGA